MLFIALCITKQRDRFGHGYSLNNSRLRSFKFMLPVTADNQPDWDFMEAYMRQQEQSILKPTIERLCNQLIYSELVGGGKIHLTNLNWKEFYFTEVFTDIQRGKRLKKADHKEGDTPYVSSTSQDNGVDGFIGNESGVRCFEDCLTLANSGSVGSAFYHRYQFIASDHVTELKRKGLDKYAYLFMIPLINRLSEKYSFNREINDERIKREKIILPANEKGEPDFAFMSSFMQSVESDMLSTTLRYFADRQQITPPIANNNITWQTFYIRDVFEIYAGKRLTKADMKKGNRPFIGATDSNNGITEWVSNTNDSIDSNVLGVNYNGSVGETFYHPYECIFSDDVKRLHLNKSAMTKQGASIEDIENKYVMLYLKTAILQQKVKYAYGYKFNESRMLKQSILLPATPDNQPDWEYMETYMRHLEAQHIITYLRYYQNAKTA